MEIYHVVLLSAIEGITEFLPISSTAHLVLTSHILNIPTSNLLSTFEISIQLGAILSVVFLYFERLIKNKNLILKSLVGFIPTGILGFTLFKYIKELLNNPFIPVTALFIGGIAIIGIEIYFKKRIKNSKKLKDISTITYKDALLVGFIQSISMIPGVSRSASSIFGTMMLGFDRKSAVEFSFILALPTMLAATGYDLLKSTNTLNSSWVAFITLGVILSFIFSLITIKWLLRFVERKDFTLFGIYRILLSILYYFLFLR